jgi:hypothetical protein
MKFSAPRKRHPEAVAAVEAGVAAIKNSKALTVLTMAALALPGLGGTVSRAQAASPSETFQLNHRYTNYREGNDRMRVDVNSTSVVVPLGDRFQLSGNFEHDTYAGATPAYSAPGNMFDVVSQASGGVLDIFFNMLKKPAIVEGILEAGQRGLSGAEQAVAGIDSVLQRAVPSGIKPVEYLVKHPRENRYSGSATASYFFDDVTLALTGGQSTEPDYKSSFGFANLNWEINQKLTTLNAGYGYAVDDISSIVVDNIGGKRDTHTVQFGLSQVTGKNSLFLSNVTYTRANGFLSNPYKLVHIRGEITAEEYFSFTTEFGKTIDSVTNLIPAGIEVFHENRPDLREQWSVSNRLVQYVPLTDASIHLDYRFYTDSWNINSHTFEVNWLQPVHSWLIRPNFRYYSQGDADFFAPFFLTPRQDGFYTSDFRLSSYGAISAGIQINKDFNRRVSLRGGFEYTFRRANLKMGGSKDDYADFNFYFTNVAVLFRF